MSTVFPELEPWHTVHAMLRGYRAAQILMICSEPDLFSHLTAGPQTAGDLAAPIRNRLNRS